MAWLNSDGLYVKFGREEGVKGIGGEYVSTGPRRFVELTLDLTTLGTAAAVIDDNVQLPTGAFIEEVSVTTLVAVTGTNAVLNIGGVRLDRSTLGDVDGFGKAAALTQTAMAAKGTVLAFTAATSNKGDYVGTELATPLLVTADYDTAAFTAGKIAIRIYWSKQT